MNPSILNLLMHDGETHRYFLIHDPNTNPEVLEEADLCIRDIANGVAHENHSKYPTIVLNQNGTPFIPSQIVDRYLSLLPTKGFPYEEAITFCESLRRLVDWKEISYNLDKYIEKQVKDKYFDEQESINGTRSFTVLPKLGSEEVDEELLRFACYVAVSHTKYGASYETCTTERILSLVSQLRPKMIEELKTHGSGKLPENIRTRKTENFTASVNDAFATIRIVAKNTSEDCYNEILGYLCSVLKQEDFPRSYSVEFQGREKIYLPIPGLPKKGINLLFACAVRFPNLHPAIERYARLAMRQYERYTNLSDEQCALPGSFAVFALGILGKEWRQLIWDYLDLCDDEHSHLQEKFLREYVKQFGFTADTVPMFVRGVLSMQNMKYSKDYATWMANAESLNALLEAKIRLSEIVPSGFSSDEDDDDDEQPTQETEASPEEVLQYAWETVCYVIWGKASAKSGQKVVEAAPEALKELYRQIFIPITENLEKRGDRP